jgi:hypothetical protein
MPKNRHRNARNRSPGKYAGRAPSEAAGRRPRDSGVDAQSASARLLVASTGSRAQRPERAVEASDRSSEGEVLQTTETEADSPPLTDRGSDSSASDSDSSSYPPVRFPKPYDGRPDQRVFDTWVFYVKNWASLKGLRSREVMAFFPQLLTGDAMQHYMREVAPGLRSKKWKPKEVFKILQKKCFPPDHKVKLYHQLKSARQGNRRAKIFAEQLTFLARHLPYVSEEFLALVFWAGLNRRILSLLVQCGIEPGELDLETLVERASRCQRALQQLSTNRW